MNIPESINLNDLDGHRFTASMMNLTESEKVCIYAPEEAVQMTNEMGAVGTAHLYSNVMYNMFDGLSAGHYTGTATFTIRL